MSSKNVVSDAEWVEARVAFMQLEAEHKAATIALAKKRQALPWRSGTRKLAKCFDLQARC
jgi:predicted dithiol-disulfide oxidoreductase (DUF899 family)